MGLENANLINELTETWPTQRDKRREGAGHLRVIKKAVKNTFPNIRGQVTATHQQLNSLPASSMTAILTELLKHVVPRGAVFKWAGSIETIPEGYALCNGQNVAGYGVTPDLRGRFILGAGGAFNVGATGGDTSYTTSSAGSHAHTVGTTGGTVLTVAQIPQLQFRVRGSYSQGGYDGGGNQFYRAIPGNPFTTDHNLIEPIGGGQAHTHSGGSTNNTGTHSHSIANVIPPYYALAFIVKVTSFVMPAPPST
jgi:hypothetical protein